MIRYILATLPVLSGSCVDIPKGRTVVAEVYRDLSACWSKGAYRAAYLILRETSQAAYPYLISPYCEVESPGFAAGSGFMNYLQSIPLGRDEGAIRSLGISRLPVEANDASHAPFPIGTERVFAVQLYLEARETSGAQFYVIRKVVGIKSVGADLNKLKRMSIGAKARLYDSVFPGN